MNRNTPLKPNDNTKGINFRDDDYQQLHQLRVRSGSPTYKDAAMQAIRLLNATLQAQQGGHDMGDMGVFLAQAQHMLEDDDPAKDLVGTVMDLTQKMREDEDRGAKRFTIAYTDGLSEAFRYEPQQATLEVES